MSVRPPPPGVHKQPPPGVATSPPPNAGAKRPPPAAALAAAAGAARTAAADVTKLSLTASKLSFLCHYTVVDAVINDKIVTTVKESPTAVPKTMTRTSVSKMSSNILSLVSVPSSIAASSVGASSTASTLFPVSACASTADDSNAPLPAQNNGGALIAAPNALVQEIIAALTRDVVARVAPLTPSQSVIPAGTVLEGKTSKEDDEAPQDRTGLNLASDKAYAAQQGFVGLVLRDTSSKASVNAVFNLSRLLDIQLVVGADGPPMTTMPEGDFKGSAVMASLTSGENNGGAARPPPYSAEATLGLLQGLVKKSKEQQKPVTLQLLFAHHSEPMRNVTVAGIPQPVASVRSMTTLILNIAPFSAGPTGALLMLSEDSEGVRSVCKQPSTFSDMALYADTAASVGLCPPTAAAVKAMTGKHLLLCGQQSQLPTVDKRNEKRVLDALQKSIGHVYSGSLSTFKSGGPSDDSPIGATRVDSIKSTTSSSAAAGSSTAAPLLLPPSMRQQGPAGILHQALFDVLVSVTTETIRAREKIGPCPEVSATDGKESSTTTSANHVAEAIRDFLLLGATAPPAPTPTATAGNSNNSNGARQSGCTWVLAAFLQHVIIVLDAHCGNASARKAPDGANAVFNPFVATLFEVTVRPLLHAIGGIAVELVTAENERRAAEVARLAEVAASGAAAQEAEDNRKRFVVGEESARTAVEQEEQRAFDALLKAAEKDKKRIVAIYLDQQRMKDAEKKREQERMHQINDRFGKVFERLQLDERKYRHDYAKAEVAELKHLFDTYKQELLLVNQFLARKAMRLSERPERIHLWEEEKRARADIYHRIRAMQMGIYMEMRKQQHEAAHREAYLEHVRIMGEISTLNDRYHQMQYIRARLEAEVLEKESKFLNRPHANALASVVDTIVSRHGAVDGAYRGPNARLYAASSLQMTSASSPSNQHRLVGSAALQQLSPALQIPQHPFAADSAENLTNTTMPSAYRRIGDADYDIL